MGDRNLSVENVEMLLNKRTILTVFIITGLSIILAGCLAYMFSDSLVTIFFSLAIGITIGILINYFIVISNKLVKKIDIELSCEEDGDDIHTMMKID